MIHIPYAISQSSPSIDTLQAHDSLLILDHPVLHPLLITIHDRTGNLLKDSVDYRFIDSVHMQLLEDRYRNQYFIVRNKTLSPMLSEPATWIDTQLIKSDYLIKSLPSDLEPEFSSPVWSDISYSGHFGRGINIGNNQNTTLNSNFDLQLKGSLPHGIEVIGSLSDNSIPIQPEGNSQRLQEFDKVFIQLRKKNAMLIAGDHEIRNPENYFMQYYKKTKGVYGEFQSETASGWKQQTSFNYSVSKGKFQRTNLEIEEGNQGPYRLSKQGNNLFVVVLAGTERVYLDGQLLKRGDLNDYTIDYNLGEITFTPKTYISATSRIVVEYEFAEQNYLRSLVAGHSLWEKNNWQLGFHLFSEQDGKNTYQNNILTPENEAILAEAGDQVSDLTGTSIVPWESGYEEGVVLYRLIDTMGFEKVLILVTQPTASALYTASFSFVGTGNGNYEPASAYTNGEVFRWIAPEADGSHQGSYAPITRLQAPQKQQMFGVDIQKSWGPAQDNKIFSQWSLTNEDLNRFSSEGDGDDVGWAQYSGFSWGKMMDTARNQSFRVDGHMEWRKSSFKPLSPYRPVEFNRNWNYSEDENKGDEQLYQLAASYHDREFEARYGFQSFGAGEAYSGLRHEMEVGWSPGNLDTRLFESITKSSTLETISVFSRPNVVINWQSPQSRKISLTVGYQGEYNSIRDRLTDTITIRSSRFDKMYTSFKLRDKHTLTLSSRMDYQPGTESFQKAFRTDDVQIQSGFTGENSYIKWIGTLRHLSFKQEDILVQKDQKGWNILGQMLFSQRWFKDGWNNQGELSVSNGKEPRRQFQYIKVETGNGQYKYVDLNKDSIQQLNEFFPAIYPDERNYIRVSSVENTLVSTFNYNMKWSWNINLAKWSDHTFWSKWSTDNSFLLENKQLRTGKIKIWNIADTALISSRENILTNLYFNRDGKFLQEHLGYWVRKQKTFLNTGFESFNTREFFSRTTLLYTNRINSLIELKLKNTKQSATSFAERNFRIDFLEGNHKIRWMTNQKMQLEYKTGFIRGKEVAGTAKSQVWTNQLSWLFKPNLNWSSNVSLDYSIVRYQREEQNFSLEQIMMEGLRPGNNIVWETTIQRRLPNNLVITLRYNGRKTGDASVVHTGSLQANLLF